MTKTTGLLEKTVKMVGRVRKWLDLSKTEPKL